MHGYLPVVLLLHVGVKCRIAQIRLATGAFKASWLTFLVVLLLG